MNRLAGYLLMTVAIGHALVGLILYRGSLGAIWAAGFFNTIRPGVDFDRQAVFWFLTFSPLVFLLGQIANRALDRSDASHPRRARRPPGRVRTRYVEQVP